MFAHYGLLLHNIYCISLNIGQSCSILTGIDILESNVQSKDVEGLCDAQLKLLTETECFESFLIVL